MERGKGYYESVVGYQERLSERTILPDVRPLIEWVQGRDVVPDLESTFPELMREIVNAREYTSRALVLPGRRIVLPEPQSDVKRSLLNDAYAFYREIGIGPKEVLYLDVKGSDSLTAAYFDQVLSQGASERGSDGAMPQVAFFAQHSVGTRVPLEALASTHGVTAQEIGLPSADVAEVDSHYEHEKYAWPLGVKNTLEAPRIVSGLINSKTWLRMTLEEIGLHEMNSDFVACTAFNYDLHAIARVIEKRGRAFLKRIGGASGSGIHVIGSPKEALRIMRRDSDEHVALYTYIIEEDLREIVDGEERSCQALISADGRPQILAMTQNIVQNAVHRGNMITYDPHDPTNMLPDGMREKFMTLLRKVADTGYRGYLSLDFFITQEDGVRGVKILECNARQTGATYPLAVLGQLSARLQDRAQLTVLSDNGILLPSSQNCVTWGDVQALCGDDLFDIGAFEAGAQKGGIVPSMVGTLPEKIGMIFVGTDSATAHEVRKKFLRRVERG